MLPESLTGSYKRYKEDTKLFVTWLHKKALSYGYKAPDSRCATVEDEDDSGAAGPMFAKDEHQSGLRTLSTKELISQARTVADCVNPKIELPAVVQSLLYQAIPARKRCAAWFHRGSSDGVSADVKKSNDAHEHFIKVLEIVFDVLEPRFEISDSVKPPPSPTAQAGNRFAQLEVEDISQETLDSTPSVPAYKPKEKSPTASNDEYELELSFESDLQFIVYCLYEDLHNLEDFLVKTWSEVRDGTLGGRTAAFLTNISLELVRNIEEDIIALSPARFSQNSYRSITGIIYSVPDFKLPGSVFTPDSLPQGSRVEGFIYQPAFQLLEKYRSYIRLTKDSFSVAPKELQYLLQPDLMPLTTDWKMDDIIITQMLLDLEFKFGVEMGKNNADKARAAGWLPQITEGYRHFTAHYDEITVAFDKILHDGQVCIAAVFGAQVILGIHKVLHGKVSGAYRDLRLRGAIAEKTVAIEWSWDRRYEKRHGLVPYRHELEKEWASEAAVFDAVSASYTIKTVIKENSLVGFKQIFQGEAGKAPQSRSQLVEEMYNRGILSSSSLVPSKSPSFYYTHNPVYSGVESLKLSIDMEQVGVGISNGVCSVSAVSHLYNALRQKGMVKGHWVALDAVIDAHIGKLFMGSRPITASQMVNRLYLCMKLPAAALAKTYRGEKPNFKKLVRRSTEDVFALSDVSAQLMTYLQGEQSAERLVCNVARLLGKIGKETSVQQACLVNVELLEAIKSSVQASLLRTDLDLIPVTRQCITLLQRIREAFKSKLGIEYQFGGLDISTLVRQSSNVMVTEIFYDAFCREVNESRFPGSRQNKVRSKLPSSYGEDGKMLSIAAEVFQNFLAEVDVPITAEPFDVSATSLCPAAYQPSRKTLDHWKKIMETFS